VPVDLVFDELPGRLSFESVRSRNVRKIDGRTAARPKDLATLPILRATLAVKQATDEQ